MVSTEEQEGYDKLRKSSAMNMAKSKKYDFHCCNCNEDGERQVIENQVLCFFG